MGGPGDRGIGAASPAVEQQIDKPAAASGQQLSGNALMGPGQITAADGRDHKGTTDADNGPGRVTKSHGISCRG
jgi:hypothetical protein